MRNKPEELRMSQNVVEYTIL